MLRFFLALVCMALVVARADASERRIALVVGVSAYEHVPRLANTGNDARAMAAAFTRLGFEVDLVADPDRSALEAAVRRFGARAVGADAAVFYYAGHAVELGGRNWLIPTSADPHTDRDMRFEALDLDTVLEQAEGAARVTLIFLDSCRDNPFKLQLAAESRGIRVRGIGEVAATVGTLVVFSTAPGAVAEDGAGPNSPFTTAMLKHVEEPGVDVRQIVAEVRHDVRAETGGRQVPWENSSLEGQFFFSAAAAPASVQVGAGSEALFWESIRASRDPADYRAYLASFPAGVFAPLARNRLEELAASDPDRTAPRQAGTAPPALPLPSVPSSGGTDGEPASKAPVQTLAFAPEADLPDAPVVSRSMRDGLSATLAAHAAWLPDGLKAKRVHEYLDVSRPHRALLLPLTRHDALTFGNARTAALAEEEGLERCQIASGEPCAVLAVDDGLAKPTDTLIPRDMPRVGYAGGFDPARIPAVVPAMRRRPDVAGYLAAAGHKAAALHPNGRIYTTIGAASDRDAAATALDACNKDFAGNPRAGPCYLYAIGTRVVLPRRLIAPPA